MKKLFVLLLAAALLVSLSACGGAPASEQVITRATEAPAAETEAPVQEAEAVEAPGVNQPYGFLAEGVNLVPGAAFDASQLPEASSTYEVPSCAIEGMDVVYNYDTFEVTTFNDGSGEVIYSIYLIDPNVTTPEGLALGDDVQTVTEKLGDGYEEEGSAYTYHGGDTMLILVIQEDSVASIEYRLNVK